MRTILEDAAENMLQNIEVISKLASQSLGESRPYSSYIVAGHTKYRNGPKQTVIWNPMGEMVMLSYPPALYCIKNMKCGMK